MEDGTKRPDNTSTYIAILAVVVLLTALVFLFLSNTEPVENDGDLGDEFVTLSLKSDKDIYVVGESIQIDVILNTNKKVQGADIVLSYDGNLIEIIEVSDPVTFEANHQIATEHLAMDSSVFDSFPFANFSKNESGEDIFTFSGIKAPKEGFQGEGLVATVNARALRGGNTKVDIVFFGPGESRDTNVAFSGRDILKSVKGLSLTIVENN